MARLPLIIAATARIRIKAKARQRAIETPCIRLCELNAGTQVCKGCLRTTDEIAKWGAMK
jgi:predicted Fe-S protein YdhL (DUF1289 family)